MLLVLVALLWLYVGPTRAYVDARAEAGARAAEVAELEREHAELRARRADLRRDEALEREARALGMVRQGERSFVVRGLPAD